MEKRSKDGDARCRPNKVKCTALIDCWRGSERSEAGKEAKKNISMIEKRYKERDLEMKPKPDAFVYSSAIDTWARSNSPEKAAQAWIIYQQMKSQYSKGNLESKQNNVIVSRYHEECVNRRFPFSIYLQMTSIIKACGFTQGGREDKHKALRVLIECMGEFKSTHMIRHTPLTYQSLLNATRALVGDDAKRRPILATIFETCCRNGQLDSTVLGALEKCSRSCTGNCQATSLLNNGSEMFSEIKTNLQLPMVAALMYSMAQDNIKVKPLKSDLQLL